MGFNSAFKGLMSWPFYNLEETLRHTLNMRLGGLQSKSGHFAGNRTTNPRISSPFILSYWYSHFMLQIVTNVMDLPVIKLEYCQLLKIVQRKMYRTRCTCRFCERNSNVEVVLCFPI